jgi:hypothetical protein
MAASAAIGTSLPRQADVPARFVWVREVREDTGTPQHAHLRPPPSRRRRTRGEEDKSATQRDHRDHPGTRHPERMSAAVGCVREPKADEGYARCHARRHQAPADGIGGLARDRITGHRESQRPQARHARQAPSDPAKAVSSEEEHGSDGDQRDRQGEQDNPRYRGKPPCPAAGRVPSRSPVIRPFLRAARSRPQAAPRIAPPVTRRARRRRGCSSHRPLGPARPSVAS